MTSGRILALVLGSLLILPAIALLIGGAVLGAGYAFARDSDGYFETTINRLETETAAITAEDVDFASDPGTPDVLINSLDADIRLRATSADTTSPIFIGIGPEDDVDAYLAGVAHDEVIDFETVPVYIDRAGSRDVAPPVDEDFWVASASGLGTQQVDWEPTTGRWAAVLMNADGSTGVAADMNVGAKAGFVLPAIVSILALGTVLTAIATALITVGGIGAGRRRTDGYPPPAYEQTPPAPDAPAGYPVVGYGEPNPGGSRGVVAPAAQSTATSTEPHPVWMTAVLDPELSRWQWLVKWILAIPHFVVLTFLWIAFAVLTVVAGVAIIFTGRYPRGIFDFNVGVMRWSWRVAFYAHTGGIGTDHYPAFSLHPEADDVTTFDVAYPERLSRGLVFVKWLLAIPHLIIVALLAGSSMSWFGDGVGFDPGSGGGILGLLVFVAGIVLLFTGRYPRPLFDLIIGLNRWVYRTVAYVGLMTDVYPPFRLDQGGSEPSAGPIAPPPPAPSAPPASKPPASLVDVRDDSRLGELESVTP